MKILFVCTAHNSLSQQLYLALADDHDVAVEYALSDSVMIEAVKLSQPDLIICPFLTTRIPREVYQNYMTLIVHPGPPGDVGPSALDWLLIGDDGSDATPDKLLKTQPLSGSGRPYWGVTVLQAIEEFDAGPVWAFEQFPIDIDDVRVTKSTLYRSSVTQAAVTAALAAVQRIQVEAGPTVSPSLVAAATYKELSVTEQKPFQGGTTCHRPLLKAAQRDFDISLHPSKEVSRRIRCADSQPGCLSTVLGQTLYIYGGVIEEGQWVQDKTSAPGSVIGCRDEAICIATCDKKAIWITHLRRMKRKADKALWPKVPAVTCMLELGLLSPKKVNELTIPPPTDDWSASSYSTFQEITVEFDTVANNKRVAYVFFDFYNGAMSTSQCSRLIKAFEFVISKHTDAQPLDTVVLMGGASYFSNGIHLNVIETATDAALESWANINAINDVVFFLLYEFPTRNIRTVSAVRGNCAAGGVAFAVASDHVVAGSQVVLNPAYRALGLYGSEYHQLSYNQRCGKSGATTLLRNMTPLSAKGAQKIGLVDHILPGAGASLTSPVRDYVSSLVGSAGLSPGLWKKDVDLSATALASIRSGELGEMAKDFWSPRAIRYHSRRSDFVRKVKPLATPLRFATHRRIAQGHKLMDEDELDEFDSIDMFEKRSQRVAETKFFQNLMKERSVIFPCYYDS